MNEIWQCRLLWLNGCSVIAVSSLNAIWPQRPPDSAVKASIVKPQRSAYGCWRPLKSFSSFSCSSGLQPRTRRLSVEICWRKFGRNLRWFVDSSPCHCKVLFFDYFVVFGGVFVHLVVSYFCNFFGWFFNFWTDFLLKYRADSVKNQWFECRPN